MAGVRMLGRRRACSGVVVNVVPYVRSVSMLAQCFLIRSRMLLGESLVWRCWGRSWGGICPGRLFVRWREVGGGIEPGIFNMGCGWWRTGW